MRSATTSVAIDDEQVRVSVPRLSVAAYNRLCELMYPRGSNPNLETVAEVRSQRIEAVNTYMTALAGELFVDGQETTAKMGSLFGARPDVVDCLFDTLLACQHPTPAERVNLQVVFRFSDWLMRAVSRKSTSDWLKTGTSCESCRGLELCEKRGCDGQSTKRVVWHDKRFVLKTCPVLHYTPDAEYAYRMFQLTHDLRNDDGFIQWLLTRLPGPGSLVAQESWLLGALQVFRDTHLLMVKEQRREQADGG